MKTVKPGNWHDAATWDAGRVPTSADEVIIEHDVYSDNKSIVIANRYISRGGFLEFRNINEASYIGTIEDKNNPNYSKADPKTGYVAGDVGLWVLGSGQLDIVGQAKKRWTYAQTSVKAGSNSATLLDASGINVGDRICFCPTDLPTTVPDWDDASNSPIDPFSFRFEERIVTARRGNVVDWAERLQFDHNVVVTDEGKMWFPEVVNMTSNVGVRGTKGRRAHIFIKSDKPQTIIDAEFSFLGPRQPGRRPELWLGRYGLHFHHCGDGSRGTRIMSNSIHDLGSRAIVPHGSHGMLVEGNAVVGYMNDGLWWDPGHRTHEHIYRNNLVAKVTYNGNSAGNTSGMQYGQGDRNLSEGNTCIYTKMGDDPHIGGGHVWNANDEGVWIMRRNRAHSMQTGFFVWQNTPNDHTIDELEVYNCIIGGMQGAYGNSYSFYNCYFYNATVNVKATPGNDAPMFSNCVFDGAGRRTHVVEMQGSAIPAGLGNGFVKCVFKNYTNVGVLMNTYDGHGSVGRKGVDLILCTFTGKVYGFSAISIFESWVREQPVSGPSYRADQKGVQQIAPFAPTSYGNGNGLRGEYFNGDNFESLAFTRIDQNLKFQQWTVDAGASPDGVDHTITNERYSVRWTGQIEAMVTAAHRFVVESFGGIRIWINDALLLNRWAESNDRVNVVSSEVSMVAATKYNIKIEHMNQGGERGMVFQWQAKGLEGIRVVPRSQLYTTTGTTPVTFNSNARTGIVRRNNCPAGNLAGEVNFIVPAGKYTSRISQADADAQAQKDFDINAQLFANANGTCTPPQTVQFKNAAVSKEFQKNNCAAGDIGDIVTYTVPAGTYTSAASQLEADAQAKADIERNGQAYANAKGMCTAPAVELKANAGDDFTSESTTVTLDGSKSTGKIVAVNWFLDSGPAAWNFVDQNALKTEVNRLVRGVYQFRLRVTGMDGKRSEDVVQVNIGKEEPKPRTIVGVVTEMQDGKLEAHDGDFKTVTVHFSDKTTQTVK